jgi:Bacterial toxin YdaS
MIETALDCINEAIVKYGSQAEVARKLDISPQRLNNWLRAKQVPDAWNWGIRGRLGLNGNGTEKRARSDR